MPIQPLGLVGVWWLLYGKIARSPCKDDYIQVAETKSFSFETSDLAFRREVKNV